MRAGTGALLRKPVRVHNPGGVRACVQPAELIWPFTKDNSRGIGESLAAREIERFIF